MNAEEIRNALAPLAAKLAARDKRNENDRKKTLASLGVVLVRSDASPKMRNALASKARIVNANIATPVVKVVS